MKIQSPPNLHYPITVVKLLGKRGEDVLRSAPLFSYYYETVVTEVDGIALQAPNDLTFGPDGRLYFTDPADYLPDDRRPGQRHGHRVHTRPR